MSSLLTLPFPERKDEVLSFIKKFHYTRRAPSIYSIAYVVLNERGKIKAVSLHGTPPYPSIARRFVRREEDIPRVSWQARMIAKGITSAELDSLIQYANEDLYQRGKWWSYTLLDETAWLIDDAIVKLINPGFSGKTYIRNGFHFLGRTSASSTTTLWIIDGKPIHARQGSRTLTHASIKTLYPNAEDIRAIKSTPKARFACVLAKTEQERAQRTLLMAFRPLEWQPARQPRLFFQPQPLALPLPIAESNS